MALLSPVECPCLWRIINVLVIRSEKNYPEMKYHQYLCTSVHRKFESTTTEGV